MMATPANVLAVEPPVTVSAVSLKRSENKVITVAPAMEPVAVSSFTAVKVDDPEATGASLMAVTEVFNVTALALLL